MEPYIQRLMDDHAAMAKRLGELEAGGNLVSLTRKALEVGLSESEGITIQKAMKGDGEAVMRLLGFINAAQEQARLGGVFKELGSGSSGRSEPTTALEELNVLAANLQKADPTLSNAKAFAKVYENPGNAALVMRERAENRPSAA